MAKEDIKTPLATPSPKAIDTDAEIDRRLKFLELQEREEKYAQKEEAKRIQLAHRKANALQMAEKQKNLERVQRGCDHRKKNGATYLAGQRDHNNQLHLICQGCMKHFFGPEVPIHLRPEAEYVGGPEVTSSPTEKMMEYYRVAEPATPTTQSGLEIPAGVAALAD